MTLAIGQIAMTAVDHHGISLILTLAVQLVLLL